MPIHKLKLISKRPIATNTVIFHFEKPAGFNFTPGQYGGFTLINPAQIDPTGITRRFSLLSTPDDEHIAIATRIQSSAYKQVLNDLAIGAEIKFAGPTGTFVLDADPALPTVMIAGGIGITPFYSMIRHAVAHQPQRELYLFYGNRNPEDAAFIAELQQLAKTAPNFKLICTMENATANWDGEVGYITHTLIKKYITDLNDPNYFVCGSPAMVTALQELLAEMGVDEAKIKVEDFPGY